MEKILKITIEHETYRQTLSGEDAEAWFHEMAQMLHGRIPESIVAAPWKKRKKKRVA